jgi:hypothetical protein
LAASVFLNDLDGALPAIQLMAVEFPQMQHLALQHPLATHPQTLAQREVHMLFAVLENTVGL